MKIKIFLVILFLLPMVVHAQGESEEERMRKIERTLDALEKAETNTENDYEREQEGKLQKIIFGDALLTLGMRLGYLYGNTAYDYAHHTSELEFPMDNSMVETNLSLSSSNLTLNAEIWTELDKDAGFNMKDKDWTATGILWSYTKSKAEMDAFILDTNLRYDFYKKTISRDIDDLALLKSDEITIGGLLGYRYEKFDFDMYDLYYEVDLIGGQQGQTLFQGTKVLTYKVRYYLPYLGLVADLRRKNLEMGVDFKYSFYPTAYDVDNHLLRGLTFYGDYDKRGKAFMGRIYGAYKFAGNWKFNLGTDITYIRIDGRTWDETHNPAWDQDQSTDARQFLFWSGIDYKF